MDAAAVWKAALLEVKPNVRALMYEGKEVKIEGDILRVRFWHKAHVDLMGKGDYRLQIGPAVQKAAGRRLTIRAELTEKPDETREAIGSHGGMAGLGGRSNDDALSSARERSDLETLRDLQDGHERACSLPGPASGSKPGLVSVPGSSHVRSGSAAVVRIGDQRLTKVYLAGKIKHNDWRHQLFPGISGEVRVQRDGFVYVGPWFVSAEHVPSHGPGEHGRYASWEEENRQHGEAIPFRTDERDKIVDQCESWLGQAVTVFAWIDAGDCYGTLAELGMAHSLNIPTYLAFDETAISESTRRDMWFVEHQAFGATWASSAVMGWNAFVACYQMTPETQGTQVRSIVRPNGGGFIYVLKSPYAYKIGKTKSLKDRTRLFSVKLPFKTEIALSFKVGDMSRAETTLHRLFHEKRLEGEWFALDDEDLKAIRSLGEAGFAGLQVAA